MKPVIIGNATLYLGDTLEVLKTLPDQSVNCCVTSPPYWGLRDYGVAGQLGLESTPQEYVEKMVAVFREVRRVLRDDGTLWLNLGDSYWSDTLSRKDPVESMWGNRPASDLANGRDAIPQNNKRGGLGKRPEGIKPKDLVGIPWRVAFALQADGWYLRQDIIWAKPNPMPESVRDRCTKSHEYLFLLAKSEKYYFDAEAIKEPAAWERWGDQTVDKPQQGTAKWIGNKSKDELQERTTKNKRSVWTVATQPFKEAHFATFPPALIEPCILAGCPIDGVVIDPFGGSGTTGMVANDNGRKSIMIELNPEYIALQQKRIGDSVQRIFDANRQEKLFA